MIFKRKAYNQLSQWKQKHAHKYSILLEGPRRVGKTTIALNFAKNEYESYVYIDFANATDNILSCFDDVPQPNIFFLRLQAETGVRLIPGKSLVIFDEIQLFPKARQAIKYLLQYGKYHYLETGSLISIKQNVKDILIPSEEIKLQINPLDYEEFLWATDICDYSILREVFQNARPIGQVTNRKLMRDLRLYMAVGGMPQAVEAYVQGKNFQDIDDVKRQIIELYLNDFFKIDARGTISALYGSIPAQLSSKSTRFSFAKAANKRASAGSYDLLFSLADSKTVLPCYNTTDPRTSMTSTKNINNFKLYLADTGLFVTLMFLDKPKAALQVYAKLMSDSLPANLGHLYENLVAQMLNAAGNGLYYHIWDKPNSTHKYEVDFLCGRDSKIDAFEVKSSGIGKHESLKQFARKYSKNVKNLVVLSQKDITKKQNIKFYPFYLAPFLFNK